MARGRKVKSKSRATKSARGVIRGNPGVHTRSSATANSGVTDPNPLNPVPAIAPEPTPAPRSRHASPEIEDCFPPPPLEPAESSDSESDEEDRGDWKLHKLRPGKSFSHFFSIPTANFKTDS
jgi:hypothetical protein